jgi:hypothetical protein
MFGKKKAGPQPFVLQVLTTDYLIEGTVPGKTLLRLGLLIPLRPAQIQSTTTTAIPPQVLSEFMVLGDSVVAFIPGGKIEELEEYIYWKEFKYPVLGGFYYGPYLIRGRMMTIMTGHFEPLNPIFDVNITCQVPGSTWAGLHAPLAAVNTHWLHGYIPDQTNNP